jgi:hypothetical protein
MAGEYIRFLVTPTPALVEKRLQAAVVTAKARLGEQDLEGAFEAVESFYRWQLETQPQGRRYHKGWALHQLGMFRLQQDRFQDAGNLFLLAFVEDSLSRGEESPGRIDEVHQPAALNLVFGFGVAGSQLVDHAVRLRRLQANEGLFSNPAAALEMEPLEPAASASPEGQVAAEEVKPVEPAREPEWRRVSEFGIPWEDRVFVGGAYGTEMPILRAIRDEVRRNGLDGVLVAEFQSPAWMSTRNKSMTLLKACRRAIFELSTNAGQLVEFDWTLNFEVDDVLVVYHVLEKRRRISELSRALFGRVPVELRSYKDAAELELVVRTWLKRRRRRAGTAGA